MLLKKTGNLLFGCISDVHLEHPRIESKYVLETIGRMFPNNKETAELDYILIAGDLFDRARALTDDGVYDCIGFFTDWLQMLKVHDVKLRILEGTPSHDRNQSRIVEKLNVALGEKGCDLRYIDRLMIDYEEDHDFHILYVPDEWRGTSDEVWADVQEEMTRNGIDKVQVACMHGMFGHQLPAGIPRDHHVASRYLDIVEWFITIGHIHTMSVYKHIFAQGSPDRLSQNEEGPKGIFKILVDPDKNKIEYRFIVNEKATPIFTIDLLGLEYEESVRLIESRTVDLERGFVRLLIDKALFGSGILDALPGISLDRKIQWSKKIIDEEAEKGPEIHEPMFRKDLPKLNERSLPELSRDFAARTKMENIDEVLEYLGEAL